MVSFHIKWAIAQSVLSTQGWCAYPNDQWPDPFRNVQRPHPHTHFVRDLSYCSLIFRYFGHSTFNSEATREKSISTASLNPFASYCMTSTLAYSLLDRKILVALWLLIYIWCNASSFGDIQKWISNSESLTEMTLEMYQVCSTCCTFCSVTFQIQS